MTGKKLQRVLACLLAVLLLSQVGAFSPAVFAADDIDYTLQDGTAIIKSTMTTDEVNHALTRALVKDFDQKSEDQQAKLLDDLKWEYECEGKDSATGLIPHTAWGSIGGFTSEKGKYIKYNHPALAANKDGNYKVRLVGTKQEVTLTKAKKLSSSITLKQGASVKLPYNEDGSLNADALRTAIFAQVVEGTKPELTVNDVTIEYYATAKSGSAGKIGKNWAPLEGGKVDGLTYPAISAGEQKIRISYDESDTYFSTSPEVTVNFLDRAAAPFTRKEGVTKVAMVYNKDQSINYEATAQALREALIESADPNVSINDVTVEYKALGDFKPLDYKAVLDSNKFGTGDQTIRFTWRGNADYQAYTAEVTVEMTDTRIVSEVALKTGASITYNMDPAVMEQEIFENLIDWGASKLPEKSTLTLDDFTIEYYAENELEIDGMTTGGKVHLYMPIEGGMGGAFEGDLLKSLTYPQMGAGEQKIRVTYKGNADYCSSTPIEGDLTVNKAKVSVKVHSTSIYADEAKDKLGDGFVTTDPADKFDIYTIYGGMTSDVTTSVFVQLPERYTNTALIKVIDWALEQAGQPTLTEMMNNGITVGQLRKILSDVISSGADMPQFIKDALKKANIDIDTLVKLNDALNKLPGLLDDVRVAIGTPNQAGLYVVTAVTNNKNYETGVGTGMLLVKKHYSGVKLTWNQNFTNGKISAADVANFNFGATLSYNGKQVEDQSSVHYLYSGFTSKWKPYSSTTTPPTEPGRYVVTVVTLGGNYQAAPITRAFQITK